MQTREHGLRCPLRPDRPGLALDGLPKYDLEQWNAEFFSPLHDFLGRAMAPGHLVELTLLSNVYSETVWALSPLHDDNNVNSWA